MCKNLLIIEKNPSRTIGLRKAKEKNLNIIYMSENIYNNKLTDEDYLYIDEFVQIDTSNINIVIEKCKELNSKRKIDGVITFLEYRVPVVATIACVLNLPGNSEDTALKTRDKFLMREALAEADIPIPLYKKVANYEEAKKAALEIGFPNVIKPINMAASRNVYKNNTIMQLKEHYNSTQRALNLYGVQKQKHLLIEEFMDGQEFSVEGITFNGDTTIVCITTKVVRGENTFVEVGHVVPAMINDELKSQIISVVKYAIKALGIKNGATHTEVKATKSGVKIVEIATRLGGDKIPELVELALGVDLWTASISVALGEKPNITQKRNMGAAIYFLTAEPGKVSEINGVNDLSNSKYIKNVSIECKKGDTVYKLENGSNRLGDIITIGDSAEQAERNALMELNKINIITK